MKAKYDEIGLNYNRTRKADPYLTERLFQHLSPKAGSSYLDIGCGTGNYTTALHQKGIDFIGIDPSVEMLNKAQSKNDQIVWKTGNAEQIPLEKERIDGAIAGLTMHHWDSLSAGFKELNRVLKPKSPVVLFSSTPQQMEGYWLNHYFPQMLRDSMTQMPAYEDVAAGLQENGFIVTGTEKYFIQADLKDLFLYSGKHEPSLYLNKQVRQGISSFSALSNAAEVEKGLAHLADDIKTGAIDSIVKKYKNDDGDYLFIIGKKE